MRHNGSSAFVVCMAMVVFFVAAPGMAGVVGYWTFDGDNADDSVGGHNGTLTGGGFSSDVPGALGAGRSLDLTGGDNYVTIGGNEQDFDLGTGITVSSWVKGFPDGGWEPYIAKNGEPNGWQFRRHGGSQTLDWTTRGAGPSNGDFESKSTAASDGQWHHIASTFDGALKAIYVDGALDNVQFAPGSLRDSPDPLVFGARINGSPQAYSRTRLDEVVVYDAPLGPNQISSLASGGNPQALPAAQALPLTVWNFSGAQDLQGWEVLKGEAHFRTGDGGGMTPGNGSGGFAHDGAHEVFLAASPEFKLTGDTLDGSTVLQVVFAGGQGDQSNLGVIYNTPADVMAFNGGNTSDAGQKGLAFLNTATGQYDATIFENDNGGTNWRNFTLASLTGLGLDPDATYRMHYFETDQGGWGWGQLNGVVIAAQEPGEVPEPATLALLGLAAAGLGGYIRRRHKA